MSIRTLHLLGSPVLRQESPEVSDVTDEVRRLVDDLFDTMRAAQGVGLAANQVGLARRVAVVDVGDDDPVVLINPVITERSGVDRAEEGCLSVPEVYGEVERAQRVTVETTTVDGERITVSAEDLKTRAIQHEVDHLDGVLFFDHLSPLKRKLLLARWKRLRKGETGYLKEVVPAPVED